MSKRILIISPYFPPVNAADMQRVRMSLPYFAGFNWEAEVVVVHEAYAEMPKDDLLLQSIPPTVKIHQVSAIDKKWTSKFGLGSIALRSLYYYKKKVNQLLTLQKFDLIYFSTTQFPVCVLGPYWKKRFGISYIIDIQDPWHSEYYQNKPRAQRPPKYWFAYRLNRWLEPIAIKEADGLISVSEEYIVVLKRRYPQIKPLPTAIISFGAFALDLEIASHHALQFDRLLQRDYINVVYIGRGGTDMHKAVRLLFSALKRGLVNNPELFSRLRLHFIGTSYAPAGQGKPTILPLAAEAGVQDSVTEITDRIGYYHTLATLQQADALFIPGSDDPGYTASKLYPYLLTMKPLLTLFDDGSPAVEVLTDYGLKYNYTFRTPHVQDQIKNFLTSVLDGTIKQPVYNLAALSKYSAAQVARRQCDFFNEVIKCKE